MPKVKKTLDRKTRRAIANAVRSASVSKTAEDFADYTLAMTTNGHLAGLNGGTSAAFNNGLGTAKATSSGSSGSASNEPKRMLPKLTGELFISQRIYAGSFAMRVFTALHPQIDYLTFQRRAGSGEASPHQLAFLTRDDADTFDAWVDDYGAKFHGEKNPKCLPAPIDGSYPFTVKSDFGDDKLSALIAQSGDKMFTQWLWILQNCEDEARHTGQYWFFKSEADAILFRLRF